MKTLKNYDHFSKEYRANESAKINENVFSDIFNKVISFFKNHFGKHAWIYYALYLQKKGKLPKGIELICPPTYANISDIPTDKEIEDSQIKSDVEPVDNETVEDEKENEIPGLKDDENQEENKVDNEIEELEKVKESLTKIYLNESLLDDNQDFVSLDHPDPNVVNEDVAELKEEVKRLYNMNALRAGRHQEEGEKSNEFGRKKTNAIFIWGAPGIGKTEILHQVAKELDIAVIEWHLSQIEPTDFRGIPKIENIIGSDDSKDERTVWKLPSIFPTSNGKNGKGGIMFFDEMNRAPQMVLSASLALALSGKHGDYDLPPRWIIIAAGNRKDDINTTDLTDDPILWNRFAHVNYTPTVDDWVKWALTKKDINPFLISYLQYHPNYFHRLDLESGSPVWASPRSWEMASQDEYNYRGEDWSKKLTYPQIQKIYTKYVGLEPTLDFINYMKLQEFFSEKDIQDIYDGNAEYKKIKWPTRPDQIRACSIAIATFKQGKHLTADEVKNVYDFATMGKENEAIVTIGSYFLKAHPYIKKEYLPIWIEFAKKWQSVFQKTMVEE